MGRKKKKQTKPWCWYCNREFDDEKILIQHQKAKHFKCPHCHKKLYTGPGLSIHCVQVHKETIDKVPNSLPNRNDIEREIYGMEGIPEEDLKEHERQKAGRLGSRHTLDDDDEESQDAIIQPSTLSSPVVSAVPPCSVGPVTPMIGPGTPMMPPMMSMGPIPPFLGGHGMVGPLGHMGALPPPGAPPTNPYGQPLPKPLFPSAVPTCQVSTANVVVPAKPAFPAYSQNNSQSVTPNSNSQEKNEGKKNILITAISANARIIHPEEDVSLEEKRAAMPRYQQVAHPQQGARVSTPFTSLRDSSPTVSTALSPSVCLPLPLSSPPASRVITLMLPQVVFGQQEERRSKMAKYAAALTSSTVMGGQLRPPHPTVMVEAPPAVTSMGPVVSLNSPMFHAGATIAMPVSHTIVRPAVPLVSAPIMTALPALPPTMPPLPLGAMHGQVAPGFGVPPILGGPMVGAPQMIPRFR